jgi:hypothetical protein
MSVRKERPGPVEEAAALPGGLRREGGVRGSRGGATKEWGSPGATAIRALRRSGMARIVEHN